MLTEDLAKEFKGLEDLGDSDSNEPSGSLDPSKDSLMGSMSEGEFLRREF